MKDGGTGGYATFIGYSARTGIAAVLLSNTASWTATPALGRHLLNANFPLPTLHRQVPIDPGKLSVYAGRYPLTQRFVLTVTSRDGRLMVQATGQEEYEVFPESDTRFFYPVVDAQISFELTPDGTASPLVLHQNGRDRRGYDHPEGRTDIELRQATVVHRCNLAAEEGSGEGRLATHLRRQPSVCAANADTETVIVRRHHQFLTNVPTYC